MVVWNRINSVGDMGPEAEAADSSASSSVERLVGAQECDSRSVDCELEHLYAKVNPFFSPFLITFAPRYFPPLFPCYSLLFLPFPLIYLFLPLFLFSSDALF